MFLEWLTTNQQKPDTSVLKYLILRQSIKEMFAWLLAHKVVGNKIHRKHSFVVELLARWPQLGLKETGDVKGFWCPKFLLWKENQNGLCTAESTLHNWARKPLGKCDVHISAWMESGLSTWWSHAEHVPEAQDNYRTLILKWLLIPWGQIFSSNICIRVHHNSYQVTFNNPVAWNFLLELLKSAPLRLQFLGSQINK